MDDSADTFTAITGASADVARRYLSMTENNVQQAIELFFESPDLASAGTSSAPPPPVPHSSRPPLEAITGDYQGGQAEQEDEDMDMEPDDDNDDDAVAARTARQAEIEDDEAMARRMQEELYAGGDAGGGVDADGVRAPLARTTERLMDGPGGAWTHEDLEGHIAQQIRFRQQPRVPGLS